MSENEKNTSDLPFRFKEIEHTADVALQVRGKNFGELMKNAAEGMASLLYDQTAVTGKVANRNIELEADDSEGLLVEWLGELVYIAETESEIYCDCEFETINPTELKASVRSRKVQELKVHIKAVTYHNLKIVETETGPEAVVVFDI